MAVAFSAALAQGQSQTQLAKLGAFFTIVGDTLALYALEPSQSGTTGTRARARSQQAVEAQAAAASAINLGETL